MKGRAAAYPSPRPRKPLPRKKTAMLLLLRQGELLLEKRPPAGIWGGLWCLPEMPANAVARDYCERRFGIEVAGARRLAPLRHGFTHFTLSIAPVICRVRSVSPPLAEPGRIWLTQDEAARAAVPAPVRKLLLRLNSGDRETIDGEP
jgi:A/G-specific adenine glycosylase